MLKIIQHLKTMPTFVISIKPIVNSNKNHIRVKTLIFNKCNGIKQNICWLVGTVNVNEWLDVTVVSRVVISRSEGSGTQLQVTSWPRARLFASLSVQQNHCKKWWARLSAKQLELRIGHWIHRFPLFGE